MATPFVPPSEKDRESGVSPSRREKMCPFCIHAGDIISKSPQIYIYIYIVGIYAHMIMIY